MQITKYYHISLLIMWNVALWFKTEGQHIENEHSDYTYIYSGVCVSAVKFKYILYILNLHIII